jgi:hypothetical protein
MAIQRFMRSEAALIYRFDCEPVFRWTAESDGAGVG